MAPLLRKLFREAGPPREQRLPEPGTIIIDKDLGPLIVPTNIRNHHPDPASNPQLHHQIDYGPGGLLPGDLSRTTSQLPSAAAYSTTTSADHDIMSSPSPASKRLTAFRAKFWRPGGAGSPSKRDDSPGPDDVGGGGGILRRFRASSTPAEGPAVFEEPPQRQHRRFASHAFGIGKRSFTPQGSPGPGAGARASVDLGRVGEPNSWTSWPQHGFGSYDMQHQLPPGVNPQGPPRQDAPPAGLLSTPQGLPPVRSFTPLFQEREGATTLSPTSGPPPQQQQNAGAPPPLPPPPQHTPTVTFQDQPPPVRVRDFAYHPPPPVPTMGMMPPNLSHPGMPPMMPMHPAMDLRMTPSHAPFHPQHLPHHHHPHHHHSHSLPNQGPIPFHLHRQTLHPQSPLGHGASRRQLGHSFERRASSDGDTQSQAPVQELEWEEIRRRAAKKWLEWMSRSPQLTPAEAALADAQTLTEPMTAPATTRVKAASSAPPTPPPKDPARQSRPLPVPTPRAEASTLTEAQTESTTALYDRILRVLEDRQDAAKLLAQEARPQAGEGAAVDGPSPQPVSGPGRDGAGGGFKKPVRPHLADVFTAEPRSGPTPPMPTVPRQPQRRPPPPTTLKSHEQLADLFLGPTDKLASPKRPTMDLDELSTVAALTTNRPTPPRGGIKRAPRAVLNPSSPERRPKTRAAPSEPGQQAQIHDSSPVKPMSSSRDLIPSISSGTPEEDMPYASESTSTDHAPRVGIEARAAAEEAKAPRMRGLGERLQLFTARRMAEKLAEQQQQQEDSGAQAPPVVPEKSPKRNGDSPVVLLPKDTDQRIRSWRADVKGVQVRKEGYAASATGTEPSTFLRGRNQRASKESGVSELTSISRRPLRRQGIQPAGEADKPQPVLLHRLGTTQEELDDVHAAAAAVTEESHLLEEASSVSVVDGRAGANDTTLPIVLAKDQPSPPRPERPDNGKQTPEPQSPPPVRGTQHRMVLTDDQLQRLFAGFEVAAGPEHDGGSSSGALSQSVTGQSQRAGSKNLSEDIDEAARNRRRERHHRRGDARPTSKTEPFVTLNNEGSPASPRPRQTAQTTPARSDAPSRAQGSQEPVTMEETLRGMLLDDVAGLDGGNPMMAAALGAAVTSIVASLCGNGNGAPPRPSQLAGMDPRMLLLMALGPQAAAELGNLNVALDMLSEGASSFARREEGEDDSEEPRIVTLSTSASGEHLERSRREEKVESARPVSQLGSPPEKGQDHDQRLDQTPSSLSKGQAEHPQNGSARASPRKFPSQAYRKPAPSAHLDSDGCGARPSPVTVGHEAIEREPPTFAAPQPSSAPVTDPIAALRRLEPLILAPSNDPITATSEMTQAQTLLLDLQRSIVEQGGQAREALERRLALVEREIWRRGAARTEP